MNVNAVKYIQDIIDAEGGAISFSRFMSLALYHPDFGYYMRPHEKFGLRGDFVTAPIISPLYAQTLAKSVLQEVASFNAVLEWGAGNGQLAKDMLQYWASHDLFPQYFIYEISPACRAMQRDNLKAFEKQVVWLDVPPASFEGVIIANEVLDALPIDLFYKRDGQLFEYLVGFKEGQFQFLNTLNKEDYIVEKHDLANQLFKEWIQILKAGKLIVIDYGFLEHEYYHPDRSRGTLMCHYQHTAHDDPFINIGLQDITAHVNFSDCIEIASQEKCDATLFTQAQYLIEHGILDLAQDIFSEDIKQQRLVSQAIRQLLEPQEMGEMFKVLVVVP